MPPPGPRTAEECEAYFLSHGLPWFVAAEDRRLARDLTRARLLPWIAVAVLAALAAGIAVGLVVGDAAAGVLAGAVAGLAVAALFAATVLRGTVIARWALRRAVSELGTTFPLVTRALPLLLLFTTFLFINTEVWQVASSLSRSVLWTAVLLFAAVAVAFLLVRLPEELANRIRELNDEHDDDEDVDLNGRQRANLLLVLLVSQALQVFVLAVAVFGFFVVFGLVAISDPVVESWIGHPPTQRHWTLGGADLRLPVSNELFQVSVFLAAFSGLYFTVYAVSDQNYREQFFVRISRQLERAVQVRATYTAALAVRDQGVSRD